jgi:hypothetical protein
MGTYVEWRDPVWDSTHERLSKFARRVCSNLHTLFDGVAMEMEPAGFSKCRGSPDPLGTG